jgi:hypothetical protein
VGLPGCVMYSKYRFDFVLPTILSGEKITRPMLARIGHGFWSMPEL